MSACNESSIAFKECSDAGLSDVGNAARVCAGRLSFVGQQDLALCCLFIGGGFAEDCAGELATLSPLSVDEGACCVSEPFPQYLK